MRLQHLILFTIFAGFPLKAAKEGDDSTRPFLSYHWSGGHSPYRKCSVEILHSGDSVVQIDKHGTLAFSYRTELSAEEMETLRTLIASTEFFSQKNQTETLVEDTGTTEIVVMDGEQSKTLTFLRLPALDAFTQFVWKLVVQADALSAIETDGDIYTAIGVLNPRRTGMKALQPDRFRKPLSSFAKRSSDRQKISCALQGLAWITTPETYAGFVAREFKNPKRRDLILHSMPGPGNMSESHWKALCPLFLEFVLTNQSRRDKLSKADNVVFEACVELLAEERSEALIPLLKKSFDEYGGEGMHKDIIPLARLGRPGLEVLIPYLECKEDAKRGNAVELLTIASRGNPRSIYANPYSDSEYAEMIPVFQEAILPQLSKISESDSSERVRKLATDAVSEIRGEIAK